MKTNFKIPIAILILFMSVSLTSQAQFGKKLKDKFGGGSSNSNTATTTEETSESKESESLDLSEWNKSNEGKVVFYNKSIEYETSSSSDSESKVITERVIGGDGPFSFRAYLGKSYVDFDGCDGFDIRYTIGSESITIKQLEEELPAYYVRMASNYSYYDSPNAAVGVPLNSDAGKYYDMYTAQEDAYRILLSRVKDQLTVGASLTLKVEIIGLNGSAHNDVLMASGEITLKVTAESSNLQSLNCRCGKAGMTDATVMKEVKEAFEFQFDDVKEVYHVVLLDREFTENYDDSYPVKNVIAKGMWANIVYQKTDGIFMMVKRYIFFKKVGNDFSDKASIGDHKFYLPVSPTCAK